MRPDSSSRRGSRSRLWTHGGTLIANPAGAQPAPEIAPAALRPENRSLRAGAGIAAAVVAGTALELLRQPGVPALNSLWGEDGGYFLQQALQRPLTELVFVPRGGYAHLVPRILAFVASLFPLRAASVVMSGGAALLLSLLAVFVYEASSGLIRSRAIRAGLAASLLLVPVAQVESTNNAANVHFFLGFAAFWALVWVPPRWSGILTSSLVLIAAALSDPLVALLLPLAIVRVLTVRGWKFHIQTVVWAAATAVQLVVALMAPSGPEAGVPSGRTLSLTETAVLYPLRVVAVVVAGARWADGLWVVLGATLVAAAAGVFVAWTLFTASSGDWRTRTLALTCVGESVVLFAVGTYFRGDSRMLPTATTSNILTGAPRYTVGAILFLYGSVALMLDHPPAWKPVSARTAAAVVGAVFAFTSGMNFALPNGRTGGPAWNAALAAARTYCAGVPDVPVSIPITPAEWSVTVPCRTVLAQSP